MVMEGKRILFYVALGFSTFSLVLVGIAFSTPYWVVSWPRVHSGFKMFGLWEACFSGMVLQFRDNMKAFHGCWWVLAPEYHSIRAWLMPSWFIMTQIFVTVCLVAEFVTFCILIHLHRGGFGKDGRRINLTLLQTATGLTLGSAVVMFFTLVLFGVEVYTDRLWMPNKKLNYLSWSYGIAVVSAFFTAFASVALVVVTFLARKEYRQPGKRAPHGKGGVVLQRPPATHDSAF